MSDSSGARVSRARSSKVLGNSLVFLSRALLFSRYSPEGWGRRTPSFGERMAKMGEIGHPRPGCDKLDLCPTSQHNPAKTKLHHQNPSPRKKWKKNRLKKILSPLFLLNLLLLLKLRPKNQNQQKKLRQL